MASNIKQLVCPISDEKINERVTRINALIGILLLIGGFVSGSVIFPALLMIDFYIRAFTKARFSPVSYFSYQMTNMLQLDKKVIDKAPKIFAARLGFLMTLLITLLMLSGLNLAALLVGGVLVFFASLELALAICVGCVIYTYLILPFYK
jgi:hypothetical protein